jgi:hypothetical protein
MFVAFKISIFASIKSFASCVFFADANSKSGSTRCASKRAAICRNGRHLASSVDPPSPSPSRFHRGNTTHIRAIAPIVPGPSRAPFPSRDRSIETTRSKTLSRAHRRPRSLSRARVRARDTSEEPERDERAGHVTSRARTALVRSSAMTTTCAAARDDDGGHGPG